MTQTSSLEERYSRAIRSSNLKVKRDFEPGDVDKLIAAGWVADGLGTTLYRLRVEFDAVASDVRRQGANATMTERLLILMRLKTLRQAKDELGRFAQQRATKTRTMLDAAAVALIAGRVLDVYLDPNCHHCTGRGYSGGTHRGEGRLLCRPCSGSGHRRDWIGKTAEEQAFAAHLLTEIARSTASASAAMARFLRQSETRALESRALTHGAPCQTAAGISQDWEFAARALSASARRTP